VLGGIAGDEVEVGQACPAEDEAEPWAGGIEITHSDEGERWMVIERNKAFKEPHAAEAEEGLARLEQVAREGGNLFELMTGIVEHCSVGQVTHALFETRGKFPRDM